MLPIFTSGMQGHRKVACLLLLGSEDVGHFSIFFIFFRHFTKLTQIFRLTVCLLAKGANKPKADFSLIVSFATHSLSSVADWPIFWIRNFVYLSWPICNGRESAGAKETIREKSALGLFAPLANKHTVEAVTWILSGLSGPIGWSIEWPDPLMPHFSHFINLSNYD